MRTREISRQRTDSAALDPRVRQRLVVLLAVHSGYTDAVGFLALGGAFTSVMTGNMVLFGLSVARGQWTLTAHTCAAIASYILGCVVGARIAGAAIAEQPPWPATVSRALRVELLAFSLFALGWLGAGGHPGAAAQLGLLALNAAGLGIQSSAIQRLGVSGLSTTYMTGTLTTAMAQLATGKGLRSAGPSLQLLIGLIAGAMFGAIVTREWRLSLPVAQILFLSAVVVGSLRRRAETRSASPS